MKIRARAQVGRGDIAIRGQSRGTRTPPSCAARRAAAVHIRDALLSPSTNLAAGRRGRPRARPRIVDSRRPRDSRRRQRPRGGARDRAGRDDPASRRGLGGAGFGGDHAVSYPVSPRTPPLTAAVDRHRRPPGPLRPLRGRPLLARVPVCAHPRGRAGGGHLVQVGIRTMNAPSARRPNASARGHPDAGVGRRPRAFAFDGPHLPLARSRRARSAFARQACRTTSPGLARRAT